MKEFKDISYKKNDSSILLDLYLPEKEAKAVFVYFHGGGIESGDKRHAVKFAPYLVERGIAVVSANYRMYPDAKYPEFIYDAAEAVLWAKEYMDKELKCKKLFIGGSSAGGYLSMMLCFDRRYLESVGLDNSKVSGYFHDAGQPTAHFNVLKYSGVDPRRVIVDETAPLFYIGLEKEYPDMRFIVSDNDMKGRYEQTMLVLTTLSHFGYENFDHKIMHGTHCEYCMKLDENGESVLGQMIYDFLKDKI